MPKTNTISQLASIGGRLIHKPERASERRKTCQGASVSLHIKRRIRTTAMRSKSNLFPLTAALLVSAVASLGLIGCTVYPAQKNPTLAQTTSAEQNERIFWQMAQKQQWTNLQPLLAANVVWTLPGKILGRDQVPPYLQTLNATGYMINNVIVKPNGPDMTVTYTLQLPAGPGAVKSFTELSVWQQVAKGMVMTVHSEHPQP